MPIWLDLARKELGVREGRDEGEILQFFKDAGHQEIESSETSWCAAFVGAMLHRAGIAPSGSLMARSYLKWGNLSMGKLGAITVLWRGSRAASTGHIGFLLSSTPDSVTLLGGNQGAAGVVSCETFSKSRILGYRWPKSGVS
jgi:uncharacterized protein (TIGR02594 family)